MRRERGSESPPDGDEQVDGLHYAAEPNDLKPGHRVRVLVDGEETFPEMLEAIARAEHYVHLETYIFEPDAVGELFAEALGERARAGIPVRLLCDGFGSLDLARSPLVDDMKRAGVEVVHYGPMLVRGTPKRHRRSPGRFRTGRALRRLLRRDHRKILVVDGRQAFVGGINIGEDYAPRDAGGRGWRDTHIGLQGPVVADLDKMFRETWTEAGGTSYPPRPRAFYETAIAAGSELAAAVGSRAGYRSAIHLRFLHAIHRAVSSVHIASAYFIPDRATRRALIKAARRGVTVELLLPGASDIRSVQWAGEHCYRDLIAAGVRIYVWTKSHMHAKTAVVDGVWSVVGSRNLDYFSLFHNMEVVVEVIGLATGGALDDLFRTDTSRCKLLTPEGWGRRAWWKRARSWLFFRFRRWL